MILPAGDMPGAVTIINDAVIRKAEYLLPLVMDELKNSGRKRTVVSLYGSSGTGKTSIAVTLASLLQDQGIPAYVLSGDNYPHRIPEDNDAERERIFREQGENGLRVYLGTQQEVNYHELNTIHRRFHEGADTIDLRRMGRTREASSYEPVSFRETQVLILEWTHGNSSFLEGIDIPVYLEGTPAETLKARLERNRDAGIASPFVQLVLHIEHDSVEARRSTAKIILPYRMDNK